MKAPSEKKKQKVKELAHDIDKYKTIGIIDMRELPAYQLQTIREKIRNKAKIRMSRRRIINLSLDEAKKAEAKKLKEYVNGMAALILSDENAFELFKILKTNRSDAPAKAGQIAPKDIVIKAGPTPFTPGPMISELGKFGFKTSVEGGKIAIKNEKTIVKQSEEITEDIANILSKFNMKPMKIGINLVCALEGKEVFVKDILNINEEEFISKIKNAYMDSLKLSLGVNIINAETAPYMIQDAHTKAKKLALGAEILNNETKEYLLKKAESQANALKLKTNT